MGSDGIDGDDRALQSIFFRPPVAARRDGRALVGLALASAAWRSTRRRAAAKAETRLSGACPLAPACLRRQVLPSRILAIAKSFHRSRRIRDGPTKLPAPRMGKLLKEGPDRCGSCGGSAGAHRQRHDDQAGNAATTADAPCPGGDPRVADAIADRPADDKQQHRQPIRHPHGSPIVAK